MRGRGRSRWSASRQALCPELSVRACAGSRPHRPDHCPPARSSVTLLWGTVPCLPGFSALTCPPSPGGAEQGVLAVQWEDLRTWDTGSPRVQLPMDLLRWPWPEGRCCSRGDQCGAGPGESETHVFSLHQSHVETKAPCSPAVLAWRPLHPEFFFETARERPRVVLGL